MIGSDIGGERLSLAETAVLRDAFVARLRSGRDMSTVAWTPRIDDVLAPLEEARQRVGAHPVILLHHLERSIGAVRVSSAAVLASPRELMELLRGDLFVTTDAAEDGLALSIATEHVNRTEDRHEFWLSRWGRFAAS